MFGFYLASSWHWLSDSQATIQEMQRWWMAKQWRCRTKKKHLGFKPHVLQKDLLQAHKELWVYFFHLLFTCFLEVSWESRFTPRYLTDIEWCRVTARKKTCEETKKSPFPHKSEIGFVRINQQASIAAPYFYSSDTMFGNFPIASRHIIGITESMYTTSVEPRYQIINSEAP